LSGVERARQWRADAEGLDLIRVGLDVDEDRHETRSYKRRDIGRER
jgi:hypothetical protein